MPSFALIFFSISSMSAPSSPSPSSFWIAFICSRTNLSDADAYQFCSLAVDFRVTQTVNGEKGVHGMLKKGLLF